MMKEKKYEIKRYDTNKKEIFENDVKIKGCYILM